MPHQPHSFLYRIVPETGMTKAEMILEFCKEPRTIDEITKHVKIAFHQRARESYVYPLLEKGQLCMTGQTKRCFNNKYVTKGYEPTPIATQANILEFCQVPRTRKEIQEHFGLVRFKQSNNIRQLIDEGRLIADVPNYDTSMVVRFVSSDSTCPKTKREAILSFCRTPKTRAEISEEFGLRWVRLYDDYILPFIKSGKIRFEFPESPKCKNQRYITVQE